MSATRRRILLFTLLVAMAVPTAAGDDPALPRFVDITREAGIVFVHSFGDEELSNIVESSGAGCVLFDYDDDGDLDIYLVNGRYLESVSSVRGRSLAGKLKNALYRNNGDGTFTDISDAAGVGDPGFGMAAVSADYDNDGDRDLFVTNYDRDTLYRNDGDGTFTDVTREAGVGSELWSVGASFFDADGDGLLDLYVGGYLVFDPEYRNYFAAEAFPGPLAYRGQKDILYHNNGDGTFTDVAKAAGVGTANGRAMGVSVGDIDDDGDSDVFVANDGMENFLYRNRGDGTFENIALRTGTAFGENGEATSAMGPEFGDFDGDGLVDLLVPDMRYGCLYRNTGDGFFEEKSAEAGLAAALGQYTSWSGNFFDFDNDGMLDIFIVNGDAHHLEPEEDILFRGVGGGRFADVSSSSGAALETKGMGRGSAVGDIDNDGDLDLLVLNLNGPARLLRNDGGNRGNWLMVRTIGTESNRDGIGARVRLTVGSVTQIRDIRSSSGYLSQSDPRAHFGLGTSDKVDRVEVRWPSGRVSTIENVKVNQIITVTEPEARAK
ncbi:MAG: CRTAC1 family protein [Thermoanaerobaculales bacterium]|nr:CRTAC1 family protein [Thermoanaerobaculales bacterium]